MQNNYPIIYGAMPINSSVGETLYVAAKGYLVGKSVRYQNGKIINSYQIVFIYQAIENNYLNGFLSTYPIYDECNNCLNETHVKKIFTDFSEAQKYCNDQNLAVWHQVMSSGYSEEYVKKFKDSFYQTLIVEKIINASLKNIPIKETVMEQKIVVLKDDKFVEQNISLYDYLKNNHEAFNVYNISDIDYNTIIASKYNPFKTENLGRLIMTKDDSIIINNTNNNSFMLENHKLVSIEEPIKPIEGTKLYTKETEDDLINSYHLSLGIKKEIILKNL